MAVTTLAQALEALNETRVRLNLGETMPEITADNLADIGVLPTEQINQFMGMFNLVLQERYFKVMFDAEDNPFRAFMIDIRKEGFGIRDVMQTIIDGVTPMWDNPDDAEIAEDLVAYAGDNFEQKYHLKKFQHQFKASINEREFSKVFTAYGIIQYINNKIANLNTSAEYWLMTTVLDELKGQIEGSKLVLNTGYSLNTAQDIKNAIESVKSTMRGAMTPTRLFNKDGIITKAQDESFLYLITTPEKLERITTQVLAGTFNMPLLNLEKYKVLLAPSGYDLGTVTVGEGGDAHEEEVLFVVLDRLAFPVGIRTWEMRTFPVPNTLWTNTWLSIEGIIGMNTFMTGVAFTGDFGNFIEPVEPASDTFRVVVLNSSTAGSVEYFADGVYAMDGVNGTYVVKDKLRIVFHADAMEDVTIFYIDGNGEGQYLIFRYSEGDKEVELGVSDFITILFSP